MGTIGLVVVKYNKKYYSRYNHMDSYPEHLGKEIVNKFQELDYLDSVDKEQYKEHILAVASDKLTEISEKEPETTLMIEWVYIIDLEKMTFSIKGGYYQPEYTINETIPEYEEDSDYDYENECYDFSKPDSKYKNYQEARDNYKPKWLKDFQEKNELYKKKK